MGTSGMFSGVGVELRERVWRMPSLGGVMEDWGFPQNLPSVLVGHVLHPQPGERVLDMCAAPGGKTTHISQLMNDTGRVIALDQNAARLAVLKENAERLKLRNIGAFHVDATECVMESGEWGECPPFPPESFHRVLVDAPCSGMGQRPAVSPPPASQLAAFPILQRKLLEKAVRLVKRGGTLVYSTCTLRKEENEELVEWVLRRFPCMELAPVSLLKLPVPPLQNVEWYFEIPSPLVLAPWFPDKESGGVLSSSGSDRRGMQKFCPHLFCERHADEDQDCLNHLHSPTPDLYHWEEGSVSNWGPEFETIGFFLAKFVKGVCDGEAIGRCIVGPGIDGNHFSGGDNGIWARMGGRMILNTLHYSCLACDMRLEMIFCCFHGVLLLLLCFMAPDVFLVVKYC